MVRVVRIREVTAYLRPNQVNSIEMVLVDAKDLLYLFLPFVSNINTSLLVYHSSHPSLVLSFTASTTVCKVYSLLSSRVYHCLLKTHAAAGTKVNDASWMK
ncbi:hypothetical protein TSUD_189320 [Trifolium subterraneum]|uniref:Uncharacterized protein n=1 Tax=Trifolium subterraneum TaxID=3900 RepID=A0A2Z6MET9_TRISU|nr:hypothetical protein TSUD_189320 [Trifolium subterraneum]